MSVPTEDRAILDRGLRAWLDEGPDFAPPDLATAVIAPIGTMRRRPRWARYAPRARSANVWLQAAAVIALVAVIGVLAVARPMPDSGTPPAPTSDFMTNDFGVSRAGQIGRGGWYRSWQFRPQVRFEVPNGWSIGGLEAGFVGTAESEEALPLTNGLGAIVITRPRTVDMPGPGAEQGPPPRDLAGWLLADADLDLGPPTSVRIAGHDGIQVDGVLAADAGLDPAIGALRLTDEIIIRPRHQFRLAIIEVGGRSVVLATIAPADQFDEFRSAADGIVGSLELVRP